MSHFEEAHDNDFQFVWGKKRGVGGAKKDAQFYESFIYDGTEYFLYDSVYLYKKGELPYIGKLVKMWQQSTRKKVKVLWFFRPSEILNYLGDIAPLKNELFLAAGEGVGLSNVNPLEAVAGKCNVLCTSKDKRNRQPSQEELKTADYIFYRTFDVGNFAISDRIDDKIDGVEARYLFNREECEKPNGASGIEANGCELRNVDTNNEKTVPKRETGPNKDVEKADKVTVNHAEEKQKSIQGQDSSGVCDDRPSKKMRLTDNLAETSEELQKDKVGTGVRKLKIASDDVGDDDDDEKAFMIAVRMSEDKAKTRVKDSVRIDKGSSEKLKVDDKRAKPSDGSLKASSGISAEKDSKTGSEAVEVTRRPDADRSKWFTGLPWEERLWAAYDQGTLVLLDNLDLEYASEEIEDIIYQAFKESCTARKIQRDTFSNPHNGRAFVIFKSRDAADLVVRKLSKGNLMLPNGRPLVGSKGTPRKPGKSSVYIGHLSIDKVKLQIRGKELEKAVSTSHCSQPNTIEYEMAMDWMLLQKKSDGWWEGLHKDYSEAMRRTKSSLKTR